MEESLTSTKTFPADAALAVLFFLRQELPLGGAAAEARFIRLFPLLMDRIFGSLQLDTNTPAPHIIDKDALPFHHFGGGWMNRDRWLTRSTSLNKSSSTETASSSQGSQHDTDPFVELLSGCRVTLNLAHGSSTCRVMEGTSTNILDILEEFAQRKNVIHVGLPLGTLPLVSQINLFSIVLASPSTNRMDPKSLVDQGTQALYSSFVHNALADFQRLNSRELFMRLLCMGPQEQTEITHGLKKWILQLGIGSSTMHSMTPSARPGAFSPPPSFMPSISQSPLPGIHPRPLVSAATSTTPQGGGIRAIVTETQIGRAHV